MTLAIVGFGPRGLASLENLVLEWSRKLNYSSKDLKILIFDDSKHLGTGKAWEIEQPATNYINISEHALQELQGREKIVLGAIEIPPFPSYTQWCLNNHQETNIDGNKDLFPARSQMGHYLHVRSNSICEVLSEENLLEIHRERVTTVTYHNPTCKLTTEGGHFLVDECLLTLGHITAKYSDEDQKFKTHAAESKAIYVHNPYEELIARDDLASMNVAIKGFGLSMIDISRQLTSYKFGEFVESDTKPFLKFKKEDGCVRKMVPYSFDGLPCAPKPFGRKVDEQFEPSVQQKNQFEWSLRNVLAESEEVIDAKFLLDAVSEVAAEIFCNNASDDLKLSEIKKLSVQWLKDPATQHTLILDTKMPDIDYMKALVEMAYGRRKYSLDFTIGQVWRHLQPTLYRVFSFSGLSGKVMKEVIDFDEERKRYSYGPPVESLLQLIALAEADILDLRFVNDPEISLINDGWRFTTGDHTCEVQMLCNSVMDAPVLKEMDSSLIHSLQEQDLLKPVHEDLGIKTHPDGTVMAPAYPDTCVPIAVLGRNAKGSVLGVDAILECFGPETQAWAKGVVRRMK